MKKPFLLTASEGYYPGSGTSDWIGCFETREEAESQITIINGDNGRYDLQFEIKGGQSIHGGTYDIVDLRDWA